MVPEAQRKYCGKCHAMKPVTLFSRCKATKDGLQIICKACHKAVMRIYNAKRREDATFREANRLRCVAWVEANREAANTRRREARALRRVEGSQPLVPVDDISIEVNKTKLFLPIPDRIEKSVRVNWKNLKKNQSRIMSRPLAGHF